VDADDIVVFGPDGHHRGELGALESLVKGMLGVLGGNEGLGDHDGK
jgi:hypothetical protein